MALPKLFFCFIAFVHSMNRLHFICFGAADIVHHPPQLLSFQRKPIILHTNAMNNTCAFNTFAAKHLKKPIPQCQACFKDY